MQLPKANKAAFTACALFLQQSNMQTHDFGLQVVLDVLCASINAVNRSAVPLCEFDFTMNFSGAASATEKYFSVNMRAPVEGPVELTQQCNADMQITWSFTYQGVTRNVRWDHGRVQLHPPIEIKETEYSTRNPRVISID